MRAFPVVSTIAVALLCSACATPPVTPEGSATPQQAVAPGVPNTAEGASAASGVAPVVAAAPAPEPPIEAGSFERDDLKSVAKIAIHLTYADVTLATGSDFRKGHVKIDKIDGDPDCKVRVRLNDDGLEIEEATPLAAPQARVSGVAKARSLVPVVGRCRFLVDIGLREAAPTAVELVRGTFQAEQWDEPLAVKLEWGDIDVGSVGPLSVSCGRCMLSGDGVDGALHYSLESGNVGLAGLTGAVEGQTLGDTVLKWRKLHAGSNVKIVSHAGDVMLFFPESTPLSIDMHAPRGEANARAEEGSRSGVPVSVTAELGNVQIYRAGRTRVEE